MPESQGHLGTGHAWFFWHHTVCFLLVLPSGPSAHLPTFSLFTSSLQLLEPSSQLRVHVRIVCGAWQFHKRRNNVTWLCASLQDLTTKTRTRLFKEALFIIAQRRNQLTDVNWWVGKPNVFDLHTRMLFSPKKEWIHGLMYSYVLQRGWTWKTLC